MPYQASVPLTLGRVQQPVNPCDRSVTACPSAVSIGKRTQEANIQTLAPSLLVFPGMEQSHQLDWSSALLLPAPLWRWGLFCFLSITQEALTCYLSFPTNRRCYISFA